MTRPTRLSRSTGTTPLDELLRYFDSTWAAFWIWAEEIGRNAPPLPSPTASKGKHAEVARPLDHRR